MTKLGKLASLIRSKNARPFELTFDIMFDNLASFERVKASGALGSSLPDPPAFSTLRCADP
jgi:hypothetical protein